MSDFSQGAGWWQASDGKWYPPQDHAASQSVQQQMPVKSSGGAKTGLILLGVFGLLLIGSCGVLVAVAGSTADTTTKAVTAAADEAVKEAEKATPTTAAPTTEAPKPTVAPTTAPPPPTTAPKPPPTTAPPMPTMSVGQANAARSARDYLSMTAFSRSGLIKQLEFEGFSTGDATFGVDSQGADWNEQAARSAKQYLEMTSFSRSGLVDQLVFEGYTPAEAEFGVSTTGL